MPYINHEREKNARTAYHALTFWQLDKNSAFLSTCVFRLNFFSFLSALVLLLLLFWSGFCRSFNWKRWLDVLHLDTTVHVSYSILSIKQSAKSNQIVFCEVYSSRSSPWNVNTIPIFAFGCLGRVLLTILWNMLNAFCMNSMKSLGLKVDSFTFHWKCEIQHQ